MSNIYTIQNIKLWCKLNNKPFELISDIYVKANKKLKWQCLNPNCREIFDASWNQVKSEKGCGYCCNTPRHVGMSNCLATKNPELAKEWHPTKNGNLTPYDVTCGSDKKAWWKCENDHEWYIEISIRNSGNGCLKCNISKGEKEIKEILTKYNFPYDLEYTFDNLKGIRGGLLRYDISVFWDIGKTKLRMLIEFDGEQHFKWIKGWMPEKDFKRLQIHDKLKNEYCMKNNINLVRIPYWEYDNIELILQDVLIHNNMNSEFIVK